MIVELTVAILASVAIISAFVYVLPEQDDSNK